MTAPVVARPARDHYLPDLHDLRLELEEAATPEGRTARFGFNPLEFESFGWRGYAQMSPIQVGGELPGPGLSVESPLRPADGAGGGPGWEWPGRGDPDSLCPRSPQPRIVVRLNVTSPDLFRLVFRFVNRGSSSVSGRVSVQEEGKFATCTNCECLGASRCLSRCPPRPSPAAHSAAPPAPRPP